MNITSYCVQYKDTSYKYFLALVLNLYWSNMKYILRQWSNIRSGRNLLVNVNVNRIASEHVERREIRADVHFLQGSLVNSPYQSNIMKNEPLHSEGSTWVLGTNDKSHGGNKIKLLECSTKDHILKVTTMKFSSKRSSLSVYSMVGKNSIDWQQM